MSEEKPDRQERVHKLLSLVANASATAGEKANACEALAKMYRSQPELAAVYFEPDPEEQRGLFEGITIGDIQRGAETFEQLAEIVGDWMDGRRGGRGR
jgi:hypothetical protein